MSQSVRDWVFMIWMSALLAACGSAGGDASGGVPSNIPVFHDQGNPERLSDWNLLRIDSGSLKLNDRVVAYDLNSSLFTDYAHKLRTVWLPEGKAANYDAAEAFDFPVGTVISKTFYYPLADGASPSDDRVLRTADDTQNRLNSGFELSNVKLIETRLLIRRKEGWVALPYVWNDEQTDAVLMRTGDVKQLELVNADQGGQSFPYIVPNANQCAGCHATNATTRLIQPIGPKARHLNRDFAYPDGVGNQLNAWQAKGLLVGSPDPDDAPRNVVWSDTDAPLDKRARSYLDINCAHCHNRNGPADTSGLMLERDSADGPSLGKCKLPIAAGTGTGNRKFGIVPGKPDESIFVYRMASTNPAEMMPELGRSTAHEEGVALIRSWISEMQGSCG